MDDVPYAAGELATASPALAALPEASFRRRHRRRIWQKRLWLRPWLVEGGGEWWSGNLSRDSVKKRMKTMIPQPVHGTNVDENGGGMRGGV